MKTISIKYPVIFLLILLVAQISAQEIQWANHAGGTGDDLGGSSVVDKAGNIYFCGVFTGSECYFKTDTLYQLGSNGMFIVKYDSEGNELWVRQYGNSNLDISQEIMDMEYDSGSNMIFCTGRIFVTGIGIRNFLAKLDTDGRTVWMRTYSGVSSFSSFFALTLDENENIYITGSLSTTVNFDTIPVAPGGFIARFDKNGNCVWAKKKFGYNQIAISEVNLTGIKVLSDKILVSGYMQYDGTIFIDTMKISHKGSGSSMIMCFDMECNIQWITEGISKMTYSYSDIAVDTASNIYYTGCFRDTINFAGNQLVTWPGMKDLFLIKMDKYGSVKWLSQTHASIAEGEDIISDKNGNIYVTGYFKGQGSFGNKVIASLSVKDMFLASYNSTGECKGVVNFANGQGNGMSQDVHGNPCFIFLFGSTTTIGKSTFSSYGSSDVIFAKCSAITGTGETKSMIQNQLLIYANPTTGKCNITVPDDFLNEKHLSLQVFDSQGKQVQQVPVEKTEGKIKLNLEARGKGIYNAVLSNGKRSYSGKIVVR